MQLLLTPMKIVYFHSKVQGHSLNGINAITTIVLILRWLGTQQYHWSGRCFSEHIIKVQKLLYYKNT